VIRGAAAPAHPAAGAGDVEVRAVDQTTRLLAEARAARALAYAPYSRFAVGAALLGESGRIYRGCNVENASFGATICAERTAVVKAISEGERRFTALAVVADSPEPATPCGICRQVLAEFAPDMTVILGNLKGQAQVTTLSRLYPGAFCPAAFTAGGAPEQEAPEASGRDEPQPASGGRA
jgi:cytidine deaminase